jgi:predicted esterase
MLRDVFAPKLPHFSWTFPDAPIRAVTLAPGSPMPAWFDLEHLPVRKGTAESAADFAPSAARIHALIDAEVAKGVLPEHIVLGGFSQGGALSLYAGLRYAKPLGGIVSFSGWLPLASELAASPALAASRVLLVHGTRDDKVLFDMGALARDTLGPRVKSLRFESFSGGHEAPPLRFLEEFLRAV